QHEARRVRQPRELTDADPTPFGDLRLRAVVGTEGRDADRRRAAVLRLSRAVDARDYFAVGRPRRRAEERRAFARDDGARVAAAVRVCDDEREFFAEVAAHEGQTLAVGREGDGAGAVEAFENFFRRAAEHGHAEERGRLVALSRRAEVDVLAVGREDERA